MSSSAMPLQQRTLKAAIGCVGTGLHSGQRVTMNLLPAPCGHGIVFHRSDLGLNIPARFDHVIDTKLCTVVADPSNPAVRVGTIEHLMAALSACGISNAVVQVDGPELPILDGSSEPFLFLIACVGVQEQAEKIAAVEVLRTVRVEEGKSFVELRPNPVNAFDLAVSIDFPAQAIGRQALSLRLTEDAFRHQLSFARTFALAHDIAALQAAGLAQGGSLNNAVVVDGDKVLNPTGLRAPDEFVRHKLLDAVGDLALGGVLRARMVAHRPGHALNNRLLRALFADPTSWRMAPIESWTPLSPARTMG